MRNDVTRRRGCGSYGCNHRMGLHGNCHRAGPPYLQAEWQENAVSGLHEFDIPSSERVNEVLHNHVRNIQINQSVFQRLMHVGSIGISSSGQAGIEIFIRGIPNPCVPFVDSPRARSGPEPPRRCEDIVSSSSPRELRRSDNQPRQILNKLFQPLGERYTSLPVLACRRCMADVNRSLRT